MSASSNAGARSSLVAVSRLLFAVAAIAFLVGGGLIHAVAGTDRVFAEIEGIGLAVLFGGLGAWAKSLSGSAKAGEDTDPTYEEKSTRK